MISVAMFNNKGGVGKTTLTCNIASYFATRKSKRVLVIDCDPQCNSTQLVMGQEFATQLYWEEKNRDKITTIRDILQPIEDGDADIDKNVHPVISSKNRFNVDLIPGHPYFSIIEDRLGSAWHDLQGGDLGGIRKTNWNTELCKHLAPHYDLIFFDLGPSLGSINRSVLIGCSKFITPMGADIFSILGIKNIAVWLNEWITRYAQGTNLWESKNKTTSRRGRQYEVQSELPITRGYCGYTMQLYITKSYAGVRRPTRAYENIINDVPSIIEESRGEYFSPMVTASEAKLGDVPHLFSLIPLAQSVNAPLIDLKTSDGLVGSQFKQRDEYGNIIGNIANNIMKNIDLEG
jgi:cellulose biosynthesis protein BcsQ